MKITQTIRTNSIKKRNSWMGDSGNSESIDDDDFNESESESATPVPVNDTHDDSEIDNEPILGQKDWDAILNGAKLVSYEKDQVIIQEGDQHQRIFQIARGSCRIVKNNSILGTMQAPDSFGEISFLKGGAGTASVIADEDSEMYVINGAYLNILFVRQPDLAGRFFHHMSCLLSVRLKKREKALFSS